MALWSHRVRAGMALVGLDPASPSTPFSLLLFRAELPVGSMAPGAHGSDFGESG